MEIREYIDERIQKIDNLEKNIESLFNEKSKFRRLKDIENERKLRVQIEEIESKICKINIEIGNAYEKQALSLNPEENLLLLLRALEYYKVSSYTESIRVFKEAKKIAIEMNNNILKNMCDAQITYLECKELDEKADKLWHNIMNSEIKEHDDKCFQLSIQRDRIFKKLKEGLLYAQESNSPQLTVDFYTFMTWNLFRRCDRFKFLSEIELYHRKAAVVLECLSWMNYSVNKEISQKYLMQALDQYSAALSYNDKDRIIKILENAFEMGDFDYFVLKANHTETIEDIDKLETIIYERSFDGKNSIISFLKIRKAAFYKKLAIENIDDNTSFFIAAQYLEERHKDHYWDSEMGPNMGDSLFQKSRGNLRLAINEGLLTTNGENRLEIAIAQVKKSIEVSDWAFIEPVYLSIYEAINNFIHHPITDLNYGKIEEILNNAKFMKGQENLQKEKAIVIYIKKLFESIIYDDKVSALNCIKDIDKTIVSKNEYEIDLEKYSKMQLNKEPFIEIWAKCKMESDKHKKGKLLEQFTVSLFSTIKGFIPVASNLNTINEEFDAIFRNNVDRPFLQALSSPLIIFECKNWSKKVDIREVKAFSVDLFDHNNLVKIGIFIAVNGFEAGCAVQQIRLSASDKILILITGEEVEKFLYSTKDTLEWLEDLISSGFK